MCGIVGLASTQASADTVWLTQACEVLRHRGPDGGRQWWSEDLRVGLGHRRLAVIDLSAQADQPMQDAAGNCTIVFNGEIYNFGDLRAQLESMGWQFRSSSDTEVVLAAYMQWGASFVARLNGMFAFALHDRRSQTLLLARDRVGEKPLYYTHGRQGLRFGSELKALMADPALPRRLDPLALDCFLSMGFVPGGRSILEGVHKLPPAHALSFDLRSAELKTWRYWQLPGEEPGAEASDTELLDELERLLVDSVRRQLVADVPVGVLLSGGVDSSIVTALACRAKRDVNTFTIRFPDSGHHDETEHARLIARHFGTNHVELVAEPSSVSLLPLLAAQFDEPVNDSSMIPTYLVTRLVRSHCTVALGGDGGDELFGGYTHFDRLLKLHKRFGRVPRPLRDAAAALAGRALPTGFRGRNWLQALGTDFDHEVPLIACYFDQRDRRALLGVRSATGFAETLLRDLTPQATDLLQRATRMDFLTYLPEDILVKADRTSMLNSLELRAPMLDYRLVEFAFTRVPSRLKATAEARKILPKRLVERLLPPEFDRRRKQGFSIPLARWLASGSWLEFFKQVLLDPQQRLFSHQAVESLFEGQARGRSNGERLFGLVMFELWRREYGIQVSGEA
jgi:asparagine synthase (glutamine-hydrolysing)